MWARFIDEVSCVPSPSAGPQNILFRGQGTGGSADKAVNAREKDGEKEPGPDLSGINWDFIPFASALRPLIRRETKITSELRAFCVLEGIRKRILRREKKDSAKPK